MHRYEQFYIKNIIKKILNRYDKIPSNNFFNIIKYKFNIINKL